MLPPSENFCFTKFSNLDNYFWYVSAAASSSSKSLTTSSQASREGDAR